MPYALRTKVSIELHLNGKTAKEVSERTAEIEKACEAMTAALHADNVKVAEINLVQVSAKEPPLDIPEKPGAGRG